MKFILILSLFMSFSAFGMDWQAMAQGEESTGKMLKEVVQLRKESEKESAQARLEVQITEESAPHRKIDGELEALKKECALWKQLAFESNTKATQLQGQLDTLHAAPNYSQRQVGAFLAASKRQNFYSEVMQFSIFAVPFLLYCAWLLNGASL